jgi:hypothetical protein
MKDTNNMKQKIGYLLKVTKLDNPNLLFIIFLGAFVADSVVMNFAKIPVFVGFMIIFIPVIIANILITGKVKWFFLTFLAVFVLVTVITNFIYIFNRKNISDLLFIFLLIASYYFYVQQAKYLSQRTVYVFCVVVFLLFSATFAGFNSGWFSVMEKTNVKDLSSVTKNISKKKITELHIGASTFLPAKVDNENKNSYVEYLRKYHNGLFRLPHVASYFFGFLFLFFGYQFQRFKKYISLLLATAAFFLMIYTGVRTLLVAIFLALLLFSMYRRFFKLGLALLALGLFTFIFRHALFDISKGFFLGQYFSMLITVSENYLRFSRAVIWQSWWYEMTHFAWFNWFIGKSYFMSILANAENINWADWFHNDFLSVAYTYGLVGLVLYAGLFYKIFTDNKALIKNNLFLFTFYFSMLFSAIINGFYYYYPIFLMFLFVLMLKQEKDKTVLQ